jgi:hypothetical protein
MGHGWFSTFQRMKSPLWVRGWQKHLGARMTPDRLEHRGCLLLRGAGWIIDGIHRRRRGAVTSLAERGAGGCAAGRHHCKNEGASTGCSRGCSRSQCCLWMVGRFNHHEITNPHIFNETGALRQPVVSVDPLPIMANGLGRVR